VPTFLNAFGFEASVATAGEVVRDAIAKDVDENIARMARLSERLGS
jgi:hypothetical protein